MHLSRTGNHVNFHKSDCSVTTEVLKISKNSQYQSFVPEDNEEVDRKSSNNAIAELKCSLKIHKKGSLVVL